MRAFRSNWRSLDLTKRPLSYTAAKDLMRPKGYPVIHGYVSSHSTSPQPEGLPWDLQRTCRHSCVFCFSLLKVHCSNIPYHSASSRSEGCCFVDATVHEIHEALGEMRQHNLSGASKSSCNTGQFLEIDIYLSYFSIIVQTVDDKTWLSQSVFMVISEFTHHTEAWAGGVGRRPVS